MRKVIFTLMLSLFLLVSVNVSQAAPVMVGVVTLSMGDPYGHAWYDYAKDLLWLDTPCGPATWDVQKFTAGSFNSIIITLLPNHTDLDVSDLNWDLPTVNEYLTLPTGSVFGVPIDERPLWTSEEYGELSAIAINSVTRNANAFLKTDLYVALVVTHLETSEVPIPGALWLFGSGILALVTISRKTKP